MDGLLPRSCRSTTHTPEAAALAGSVAPATVLEATAYIASDMQDDAERRLTRLSICEAMIDPMTHTARTKIAAAVVVLFLAALSAAGLLSHAMTSGAGVTGQLPSALHTTPGAAQIRSQSFEYDSND